MSQVAKKMSELRAQRSGEQLEVTPQQLKEHFLDTTFEIQLSVIENASKMTFEKHIASLTLLDDINKYRVIITS